MRCPNCQHELPGPGNDPLAALVKVLSFGGGAWMLFQLAEALWGGSRA